MPRILILSLLVVGSIPVASTGRAADDPANASTSPSAELAPREAPTAATHQKAPDEVFRCGSGMIFLPALGPTVQLGVALGASIWLELGAWLAVERLGDAYDPPALGVVPRLAYRKRWGDWALGGSLGLPILQDDRQKVRDESLDMDEYRDYLTPGVAPGVEAGWARGSFMLALDAELNVLYTEYFDYQSLQTGSTQGRWETRGATPIVIPKLALVASIAF